MDVNHALDLGAVDILIVSEGLRQQRVRFRCTACENEFERSLADEAIDAVLDGPCPKCGQRTVSEKSSEDYMEGLFRRAAESGATARLVSTESEEGELLAKAFRGVAAVLRYPISTRTPPPPRSAPPS